MNCSENNPQMFRSSNGNILITDGKVTLDVIMYGSDIHQVEITNRDGMDYKPCINNIRKLISGFKG